jgi:hypothetical protein
MVFKTPEELRNGATAEDVAEADRFRPLIEAKVNNSNGREFTCGMPRRAGAQAILARELARDGWSVKRESDWRDGDFWRVTPSR